MEKKIETALYWKRMAEISPGIAFDPSDFGITEEDIAAAEAESLEVTHKLREIRDTYRVAQPKPIAIDPTVTKKAKRKPPRKTDRRMRDLILQRDGCCVLCKSKGNLEVHHIKYRSKGVDDSENNLVTLCRRCHARQHEGEPVYNLMAKNVPDL